jgi:hypothetical protein
MCEESIDSLTHLAFVHRHFLPMVEVAFPGIPGSTRIRWDQSPETVKISE